MVLYKCSQLTDASAFQQADNMLEPVMTIEKGWDRVLYQWYTTCSNSQKCKQHRPLRVKMDSSIFFKIHIDS